MDEDPLAASARSEARVARLRSIRVTFGILGLLVSVISLIVRCSASSDNGPVTPAIVPATGTEGIVRTLAEPGHAVVTSVTFSPDGKTLATCDGSGTAYLWNAATGQRVATLATGNHSALEAVAFSPDGKILAAADGEHGTWLWDAGTGRRLAVLARRGSGPVLSVAFSPGGKTLAVGDADGAVYVWRVAARAVTATLAVPALPGLDPVNSASFSPNGKRIAAAAEDGRVYVWDVARRRLIATLTDNRIDPSTDTHLGAATDASFSPDGAMLAASYADGSADVWDLATRKVVANLPDWASAVQAGGAVTTMFSPDGKTVAVAGINGSTALLDVASASNGVTLYDPGSKGNVNISAAAYSPDGKLIAVAGGTLGKTFIWSISRVNNS